jgi:predicted Zn-dependent protease
MAAMTAFDVLLFGPDQDPAGVPGEARLDAGTLTVQAGAVRACVPAANLVFVNAGFDGRQGRLEWDGPAGRMAVVPRPAGLDLADLVRRVPELAAPTRLARARRRGRTHRLWPVLLALALVLLLPLALLGAYWLNADRLAGWAAGHISLEQEARLGALAFAQLRPSLRFLEAGPAVAAVREIGGRLTAGSTYGYQWWLAEDPRVNAFALPGGQVVVFTGLLRATDSAEELAGVLAHEAQHVERRHSLRNLLHGLGWRAALAMALGGFGGGLGGDLAEELGRLGYSRDLERQADLGGLAALQRAGITAGGMVSFYARLARQDGGQIELLSTHPASTERLQTLAAAARGARYPASPLPYDWSAVKASLGGAP